jgi:hypothetical protein
MHPIFYTLYTLPSSKADGQLKNPPLTKISWHYLFAKQRVETCSIARVGVQHSAASTIIRAMAHGATSTKNLELTQLLTWRTRLASSLFYYNNTVGVQAGAFTCKCKANFWAFTYVEICVIAKI